MCAAFVRRTSPVCRIQRAAQPLLEDHNIAAKYPLFAACLLVQEVAKAPGRSSGGIIGADVAGGFHGVPTRSLSCRARGTGG